MCASIQDAYVCVELSACIRLWDTRSHTARSVRAPPSRTRGHVFSSAQPSVHVMSPNLLHSCANAVRLHPGHVETCSPHPHTYYELQPVAWLS